MEIKNLVDHSMFFLKDPMDETNSTGNISQIHCIRPSLNEGGFIELVYLLSPLASGGLYSVCPA